MKLKNFLTLKVGSGILLGSSRYNPYINYTWSNTFQVANKMYYNNIGNSGQNLQLFSGQGVKFNGTNQTITIPVNATIMTEIKRVNGAVVLNTNSQVITNYVIGTGSTAVHTDYFLFTDALTQQEIELYTNNPNKFFQDTRDGVIDNCVLNMPLHGVDKYQVDYSKYSLGLEKCGTYKSTIWGLFAGTTINNSGVLTVSNTTIGTNTNEPRIDFNVITARYMNKVYLYEFEYEVLSSTCELKGFYDGIILGTRTLTGTGKVSFVSKATVDRTVVNSIYLNGTKLFSVKIWNVSVKELTGINEVINYTADCVTSAKQLSYGSQEANFFHKSSGVPIRTGLSPFFESTPYWNNYGNTGWIPKVTDSFIFEFIFNISNDAEFRLCGNNYADGVFFGKNSGGKKVYTRVFGSPIAILTVTQDIVLITCSYNPVTKDVKTYINGVQMHTSTATATTYSTSSVLLGLVNSNGTYKVHTPIRHFKVITDAKTISTYNALKEYNKLVAKGILANFILDENGDYMQDEFGNYIMDI